MLAILAAAQIVQIVVGSAHTCSLFDDGTVSCWGLNESGQLGDGTTDDHAIPAAVPGLTDVVSLSAERARTCAHRRDGDVVCWGELNGKSSPRPVSLGRDDIAELSGPCLRTRNLRAACGSLDHAMVDVRGVSNAVAVAANDGIGCVAHASGAVSCWFSPDAPSLVPGIAGAVEVAVASESACARDRMGAVWCWQWGFAPPPPLPPSLSSATLPPTFLRSSDHQLPVRPRRVVAAGATALVDGFDRVCALSRGEVRCWGADLRRISLPAIGEVTALALGNHSCAVRGGHDVVCWGSDSYGQLGNGWANAHPTPLLVPGIRDAIALETSYSPGIGGDQWSCAARRAGRPVCWGNTDPNNGNLANPSPTPLAGAGKTIARGWVPRMVDARSLAATQDCTITLAGHVRCEYEKTWPRHEAPAITDAVQLAQGELFDCARERSGLIACWKQEKLGLVPLIIDATDLAAGGDAGCAVRADHSVWCWRRDLRKNDVVNAPADGTPVKIDALPPIARISLGALHACALAVDGSVWCWGRNDSGQVGDGTRRTRDRPVRVLGLEHVAEISAGTAHTCARLADGHVACWGETYGGQIGTHAGDRFDKPVAVAW